MESILAKALEYTLKYYLKSFTRDQFKLNGRIAQLSNLDIDGDALHSSLGLPPAINVTTAKVGKLEIVLPSVSNVQVEPIVVQIDRLDLVLEENADVDVCHSSSSAQSPTSSAKGSGYGFADKIADGMTIEVQTVNLLLETRGSGRRQGGAAWTPPMASITIRNLLLYSTNENWEVVNLKEARDFSSNKDFIYVFKKLEWGSLSIDLLPHPDMFMDSRVQEGENKRDNKRDHDGAKRVFFGGERFLEGISGQAYITVQRTQLNVPLGLEARLHITEAVCPALSEPGLRALLRFLTGLYVCLNRGDVDPRAQQRSTEAAGSSLVSIVVDHVFLGIKDTEFRLELLLQSLCFTRTSKSDGENAKNLTQVMIAGLFLRDTYSRHPCTLIQPSMQALAKDSQQIPDFAKDFSPPIYPLGDKHWPVNEGASFINIQSLQVTPSPAPPSFASQTVISCLPLMIHLQEESCLRICSFLADGVVVNPGSVLPDLSITSLMFSLQELDLTVPLDAAKTANHANSGEPAFDQLFSEAKLHIENLFLSDSPALRMSVLDLEKDPACFCLWEDQPIDASQRKWSTGASYISLSLETSDVDGPKKSCESSLGSWRCVEVKEACMEVAMATLDGSQLVHVPPPGGIVRVGIACKQYCSNTSVEQLFFVLDVYTYMGIVSEKMSLVGKNSKLTLERTGSWNDELISKAPGDTAMSFEIKDLQLKFVEDSHKITQGKPLVQFVGEDLFIKVCHRTLGGAIAISSSLRWETVEVDCLDVDINSSLDNGAMLISLTNGSLSTENVYPPLKAVLWVEHKGQSLSSRKSRHAPLLDVNIVHVIPSQAEHVGCHSLNVSACVQGVRLAGGMNYAEALLHRFGILGPDGGPSEGLLKGLENLSNGPLSRVFKAPPHAVDNVKENGISDNGHDSFLSHLGWPNDVDVSVDLTNWVFAHEGTQEITEKLSFDYSENYTREDRCWHTTFKNLKILGKNSTKDLQHYNLDSSCVRRYPVEQLTIGIEGLQTLKPHAQTSMEAVEFPRSVNRDADLKKAGGVNVEARMVVTEDDFDDVTGNWAVENLKFSVEQPIEAVVTKDELQHLAFLCKSEVDSFGRVAAGVLRLLKLEGTIGESAINQLSNLGSEGLDRFFSSKQPNRGENAIFENKSSSNGLGDVPSDRTIVTLLEKEVGDTESICSTLIADMNESPASLEHLDRVKELGQQIESLSRLLKQLKNLG